MGSSQGKKQGTETEKAESNESSVDSEIKHTTEPVKAKRDKMDGIKHATEPVKAERDESRVSQSDGIKHTTEPVKAESDESSIQSVLDSHLDEMKKDIEHVSPAITDNDLQTIIEKSSVEVMPYSNLKNKERIMKKIKEMVDSESTIPDFTKFVLDTASNMIDAMVSTEEMKEAMHLQNRKQVINVDGEVKGMEVHYRVRILEEKSGYFSSKSNAVVMIGYKIYLHNLKGDHNEVLSKAQLNELRF